MEFETVLETILNLASGENLLLVGGATAVCLLTNLIKKLLPKLKIDLTHAFDPSLILPFALSLVICGIASFFAKFPTLGKQISYILVETISMAALSMAVYKLFSSVNGNSLKQLLKDDVFGLFYNQLLALTDAKKRLINGTLGEKAFIGEIQTLVANTGVIYRENACDDEKKQRLIALLSGIIDSEALDKTIDSLHTALKKMFSE